MTPTERQRAREAAKQGAESLRHVAYMAGRRGWPQAVREFEAYAQDLDTLIPRLLDALEKAEAEIARLQARPDRYGAALEEVAWPVDGRDTVASLAARARGALGLPVGTGRGVPVAEFHRQLLARENADAQLAEDRADYFASQGER